MIQIFINGEELELEDLDFGINFQSNNIGDISTRNASYSNTVKVPKTPNNLRILGFISLVGNTSTAPYTILDTRVVSDGVEIITNGTSYVDSSDGDISLTIYDGIRVISDILGDKTLNDLDWSALNHNITYDSLQASWLNTSGYTYSVNTATRPNDIPNVIAYMNSLVPCVFWKNIWDMIFAQNGIGYSCDFFTSTDITKLLVMAETGGVVVNDSEVNEYIIGYNLQFVDGRIVSNAMNWLAGVTENYSIVISNLTIYLINGVFRIEIYVNDIKAIESQILTAAIVYQLSFNIYLKTGDKINVYLTNNGTIVPQFPMPLPMGDFESISMNRQPKHIPIDFSTIMSDTKQLDFIKDGMLMFGLMSSQDKSQSLFFKFKRIEDVFLSKSTAIDWTDKVASQEFKEDYSPDFGDFNSRHNLFKYQYEDEKQTPLTAYNGDLLIDNINLSETRDFYNSIYKITVGYPGRANAFDTDFVPQPSGLKIGYLTTFAGINDVIKFTGVQYGGLSIPSVRNLFFDNNAVGATIYGGSFISSHYAQLNLILNKFKRVTMKMKLTSIDIQNLDYTKLKFIQHTSKYYYLNKIKNFKAGQVTDVEFVELPA